MALPPAAKARIRTEDGHAGRPLLKASVAPRTFAVFLLGAMMTIAGLVFINADQTYIMVDLLNYPRAIVGQAVGNLVLADELLSMAMVSVWGAASDRFPRQLVFATGLALMAAATALHPWATTVFPEAPLEAATSLLSFRLLFATGASAATTMLTALIGDYAAPGGRSRAAGITGFATGIGALLAALLLARLPTFFTRNSQAVPGNLRNIPNGGAALIISFSLTALILAATAGAVALFLTCPPTEAPPHTAAAKEALPRRMAIAERIRVGPPRRAIRWWRPPTPLALSPAPPRSPSRSSSRPGWTTT